MPDPSVTFPGLPGSYASRGDVNVLDADTAHLQQSIGLWSGGTLSTEQAMFGDSSMKVLDGGPVSFTTTSDGANMGVHIYSNVGGTFTVNAHSTVVPAGSWTHCPAASGNQGTYQVTMVGGDDYYVDACYASDTLTTFVPSLRIVGDLDVRVKLASDDFTHTQDQTLHDSLIPATSGWRLHLEDTTGTPYFTSQGSVGAITEVGSLFTFVDGEATEIRLTVDVSAGELKWYQDGVLNETDTFTAQALIPQTIDSYVGSLDSDTAGWHFDGALYWLEIRDGIDGPVVTSFVPTDLVTV